MTRVTTMALAAGILTLATGPVAMGDMVEFKYDWYGFAPDRPELTTWSMSHITDVTVAPNGNFSGPNQPTLNFYLDIGGELSPVSIANDDEGEFFYVQGLKNDTFEMTVDLVNVPGYGAMNIEVIGTFDWSGPEGRWDGMVEITWGPGLPFGETVTQTGEWSAQIIPAPGAIALFGLAGLSGRRRRD
ncbi:MAG: hypothetical protein P8I44_12460 [Phycisphaerales bacterium]|nr:hypothetical protein [Phycisphaerales bacterium]